jgi:polyisoprenoid-binding protein YceI
MQDHFNENYMESTTYPKATFNGEIESISSIDFDKDGTYSSKVNGKLTIKDITKDVATTGSFTVKDGMVNANATFNLNPYDYNVKIPKMVAPKISESIKITINSDYIHRH